MSWRLSLPSVSNHLALTCQHSRGASHLAANVNPLAANVYYLAVGLHNIVDSLKR